MSVVQCAKKIGKMLRRSVKRQQSRTGGVQMALVPRDDALPLPKPTAQMNHPTTRQLTRIESEDCLDRYHPSRVETHLLTHHHHLKAPTQSSLERKRLQGDTPFPLQESSAMQPSNRHISPRDRWHNEAADSSEQNKGQAEQARTYIDGRVRQRL
jgi:hypothetical protein